MMKTAASRRFAINMSSEKCAKLLIALFFLVLLLVGLFTTPDYGWPCDEVAEQITLRANMKEYAIQFFGEDSSAARYYDSIHMPRISEYTDKEYGQSAYYLATPLLQLQNTNWHQMMVLWHAYTWLWFIAGCWAVYSFGRGMGGSRPVACFTTLLLYLAPRFFAEGHYNNKDVVLLSLVLLSLWLGLRFLQKMTLPRGLLFSFVGAMAVNTRIIGLIAWGLTGLCAIVLLTVRKGWNLRMLGVALGTVFGLVLFYVLMTPALWPDPLAYFEHIFTNAIRFSRWRGIVLFRGMGFDQTGFYQRATPLPFYYLPLMIVFTLPLYTLPLAAVGQLNVLHVWRTDKAHFWENERNLMLLALTILWLLPLGFVMLARPLLYNGWRHFYFMYAGIVLLGGQGIATMDGVLIQRSKTPIGRRMAAGLLCLCFAIAATGIAVNHPYQYTYYNVLARPNAERDMDLDYWVVSTLNATRKLAAIATDSPSLLLPQHRGLPLRLGTRDDMSRWGTTWALTVMPNEQRGIIAFTEDEDAPFLFYNTTYARVYGDVSPAGYRTLFTTESYGNTICTVYEKE